jgi:hypothetical protein
MAVLAIHRMFPPDQRGPSQSDGGNSIQTPGPANILIPCCDLGIDNRIILKLMSNKWGRKLWIGLI